jgi:hypothetical protein
MDTPPQFEDAKRFKRTQCSPLRVFSSVQVREDLAEYLHPAAPSDFFQLLNVDFDASAPEIRSAYRTLQRLVHPDVIGENLFIGEIPRMLNLHF